MEVGVGTGVAGVEDLLGVAGLHQGRRIAVFWREANFAVVYDGCRGWAAVVVEVAVV